MVRYVLGPALALALLPGCVGMNGFNRNLLEARMRDDGGKVIDKEIKEVTRLQPQITFPCRIAVALREGSGQWRWSGKDRAAMESWANELRRDGIASDVIFMTNMFTDGESLQALRASAAKHGADALLVIKGHAVTESRLNPLAVMNLTVVGGFLVPGSHRDALFHMEAGLVDVNNGFLYASANAEGEGSTLAPTFTIEEKDAVNCAKEQALSAFGSELLKRLSAVRASNVGTVAGGSLLP